MENNTPVSRFEGTNLMETFLHILDSIPEGVAVIDRDSVVIYANPAYTRILGIPTRKVLGKKLSDIEPEARALDVLKTEKSIHAEYEYVKTLGKHVLLDSNCVFIGGQIAGVVSIFRDISDIINLYQKMTYYRNCAINLINLEKQKNKTDLPLSFKSIIGSEPSFVKALHLAARVAPTETAILLEGESGVGKELVAKSIHAASTRSDKAMVAINCAAIPEPLFESELFGYEEGSFTGAKKTGKKGKFEMASGGTLFLDEVSELTLNMQAKLLRVLQEGQVDRIGSSRPVPVDVRILAATNNNMIDLIEQGKFRKDLYFRLNVINIKIPSLRERPGDIMLLAEEFLKRYNKHGLKFSFDVMNAFYKYPWYGNIRELQNVVKHAAIVCEGSEIALDDLPDYFHHNLMKISDPGQEKQEKREARLDFKQRVATAEKDSLIDALKMCNNNRTQAMRLLGISRRTFYKKLKQYQIN